MQCEECRQQEATKTIAIAPRANISLFKTINSCDSCLEPLKKMYESRSDRQVSVHPLGGGPKRKEESWLH